MIKNILVSVEFEISEEYTRYYGQWDTFADKLNDILNYYKFSIYKSGKTILNKKVGSSYNAELTGLDEQFLEEFNFVEFIDKIKLAVESYKDKLSRKKLYDQLIAIIIGECIILFKIAQINQCKNLDIEKVRLISDDNYSCDECKTYSKFVFNVDEIDIDIIHPYCKISILPICKNSTNLKTSVAEFTDIPYIFINTCKNITTKLAIQLKAFITPKKFIFVDSINNIEIKEDEIYISNNIIEKLDIEKLIVKELLKDKLLSNMDNWWEEQYNTKKASKVIGDNCIIYSNYFINNESQLNYIEYFIQYCISYILHSSLLKEIDIEAYNKIKNIFNKEFIKG
jgi:hypothetical protein